MFAVVWPFLQVSGPPRHNNNRFFVKFQGFITNMLFHNTEVIQSNCLTFTINEIYNNNANVTSKLQIKDIKTITLHR